jgi:hypothetical protein
MSLKRTCLFCAKPVSIRRRMALFCSDRCEHLHRTLTQAPPPPPPQGAPAPRR